MEQVKLLRARQIIAIVCAHAAQIAAEHGVDDFGTPGDDTRYFHAEPAQLEEQTKILPGSDVYVIRDQFGNDDGYLEISFELGRFAYGIVTG